MSGKRYPEEFKIEAVKQVVDRGHSVSGVATRLDITTHSLYAWLQKPHSQRHQADLRLTGQPATIWVWRLMKCTGIRAQAGYGSPRVR